MSASRTVMKVVVAGIYALFGGLCGASIFAGLVLAWSLHLAAGEEMNAGEGVGTAVLMLLAAAPGFLSGVIISLVLHLRSFETCAQLLVIREAS